MLMPFGLCSHPSLLSYVLRPIKQSDLHHFAHILLSSLFHPNFFRKRVLSNYRIPAHDDLLVAILAPA